MIKAQTKGDFSKTLNYLGKLKRGVSINTLKQYGEEGVKALASATPVDTGLTAKSWYYKIEETKDETTISFHNSNVQNGVLIAILLQYGHGTRNGGWVQGRDYINPVIQPLFDKLADDAWKEVKRV